MSAARRRALIETPTLDPRRGAPRWLPWSVIAISLAGCGTDRPVGDRAGDPPDGGASADASSDDPLPEHPAYVEHLAAIFARSCVSCHGTPLPTASARNCVRTDRWDTSPDPDALCSDTATAGAIFGVGDAGPMIVDNITTRRMPLAGPALSDNELELFKRWKAAGYPKRAVNQPPTIQLMTPPPGGATVCQPSCSYTIMYATGDGDGDSVRWSLAWAGAGKTGTFASGLTGGTASVTIDATALGTGAYTLTATLDDGTATVLQAAAGTLTVPANHNAAPTVTVSSPNGGESYNNGQPVTISWLGADPDDAMLTYDVRAVGATTIAIQTVTAPVGAAQVVWTPPAVTTPTTFRIEIAVRDSVTRPTPITDRSDAAFTIFPPPAVVKFAQQIQPILTANCTGGACHDASGPAGNLQLTSGSAYSNLVNVLAKSSCTTTKRVAPGAPDQSYLMFKLQGAGDCFSGSRMPKGQNALPAAQLQLIRDWIANGAPNN
jgi:hypothetical protein